MPRIAPSWTALLAGLALACGSGDVPLSAPPRPANLSGFDPRVVARIQEALAKVEADLHGAPAWAELGYVYASERLKNLALECFVTAGRLEPEQAKWTYREAVTLAQMGAFEEASAAMERSLAREASYPPSHARLGDYRLALGDLDGAERAYRKATELDSSYPGGWVGLARVDLQRDKSADAIAILERLCATDPEDRTFRQLLANARQQSGSESALAPENVLAESELPVWNDPWELEARAFRQKPSMLEAGRLIDAGKPDEALRLLQEERARGTDPKESALTMAQALVHLGRKPEALQELELALAHEPENGTALLMKANLLDDTGDPKGAIEVLERVTALQPTFGGAFAAMARKYAQLGYHEKALTAFQRALELGVGDYELRYAFGQSLVVLKRWSEALPRFTELCAERADHGDAWVELALVQMKSGALEEADKALARAKETGNASPRLLGDVERSLAAAHERRARKRGDAGEDG
jgi:tetratricopeptide (TPR) repeat protein